MALSMKKKDNELRNGARFFNDRLMEIGKLGKTR